MVATWYVGLEVVEVRGSDHLLVAGRPIQQFYRPRYPKPRICCLVTNWFLLRRSTGQGFPGRQVPSHPNLGGLHSRISYKKDGLDDIVDRMPTSYRI